MSIEEEAGWTPVPVWTLLQRDISFAPAWNWNTTLRFSSRSLVPIPAAHTILTLQNRKPRCFRFWPSVVLIYNMIPQYQPSWVWFFFVFSPLLPDKCQNSVLKHAMAAWTTIRNDNSFLPFGDNHHKWKTTTPQPTVHLSGSYTHIWSAGYA
jgi:hypothetical protein